MINPHLLKPAAKRWENPRFAGGKIYLAVLLPTGHRSRRVFKRATEAYEYAERLIVVCRRLYDQRILDMIAPAEFPSAEPA